MKFLPGALICACALSACQPDTPVVAEPQSGLSCESDTTAIALVQGDTYKSSMVDSEVTIRGIVTRLDFDTGFYFEEPDSDGLPTTSNAIYVKDQDLSHTARPGQQLVISGLVAELGKKKNTMTSIIDVSAHMFCATGLELPDSTLNLKLNSRQREAVEGMRVNFPDEVKVTDVYNFHRGQVTLSSPDVLRVPTEDVLPGKKAAKLARQNRERSLSATFDPSATGLLLVDSALQQVSGVMGHNGKDQVLLIAQPLSTEMAAAPSIKEPGKNEIRIASINLLNFFNGDGAGGGFPTERGAKSAEDFAGQSGRIQAALAVMQPGLIAVQELENDGFDSHSAAQSLLAILNEAVAAPWAVIESGSERLGSDFITVGIFYRSDLLEPVGPPATLDSPPFRNLSRQPLAQVFRPVGGKVQLLVVANHLKSKGSCPESGVNADHDDGQGCWNSARVDAVEAIGAWVTKLSASVPGGHALILGDMNSHRNEDPIGAFRAMGYIELVEHVADSPQHSFVHMGHSGTLDYVFATESLLKSVRRAEIWPVNSDWPQKTVLPQPWLRYSDHDPVVVDLNLSQAATSN